ncbi:MAG: DUF6438 domain-containing protein [Kangiellaceae bacterium]|jgi:hypothetical protein|nr:DUF6438 domain-containing protein [Kangiellaceae bacterium]
MKRVVLLGSLVLSVSTIVGCVAEESMTLSEPPTKTVEAVSERKSAVYDNSADFEQLVWNEPFSIEFNMIGCGFKCPIYSLTIHPNNSAVYLGVAFVGKLGEHKITLSLAQKQKLVSAIKALQPPSVISSCHNPTTDAKRYTIVLTQRDNTVELVIDLGCNRPLEARLEKLVNSIVEEFLGVVERTQIK